MKDKSRRKDWYSVGFRIQEEGGTGRLTSTQDRSTLPPGVGGGLPASEVRDSAMLKTPTLLRANGQNSIGGPGRKGGWA